MPFFGQKKSKSGNMGVEQKSPSSELPPTSSPAKEAAQQSVASDESAASRRKLQFHCQLAQGSPTGIISDFTNVRELYRKIAECYDIDPAEVSIIKGRQRAQRLPPKILFCTLNTHKIDMKSLLGGQLGLDDFIFVHVKGQPKVVDIDKAENALGLTITDNGAGLAFIKAIREGSIVSQIEGICVGDHIEKINDVSMVGCRHYEVAKMLKEIPVGSTFSLRVVEPVKSGFSEIGGKSGGSSNKKGIGSGKKTLRLKSKGGGTVEEVDDSVSIAVDKINSLLESYIGINDAELAQSIWEAGNHLQNPSEFTTAIENSDLRDFGFTESFIFDLWGAISDAKQGRLKSIQNFNEHF